MNKDKQTIEESLHKIKFMMNYDSSRTLIENTEAVNEQNESPGKMAGKTAGVAGGAALAGGLYGAAAASGMQAVGATGLASVAGLGAFFGAAVAGAAAIGLVPIVLWLADKDKAYPKTKKLFEYVKSNKDKIDQVERGLSDDQIQELSDQLYDALKGIGTTNKQVYAVFNSLVTISDFAALIATFNEDHLDEGDGDLLEWLDDDFDISSMWNKIYIPLRNIVKKFAKKMALENPTKTDDKTDAGIGAGVGAGSGASGGYRPAQGTNEDPYKLGKSGSGIFKVQECLGGLVLDGKFGQKTQAKMMELARQYVNGFTDADIDTICKLANPRRDSTPPERSPITKLNTNTDFARKQIPIKMADFAPKLANKLRPSPFKPSTTGVTP